MKRSLIIMCCGAALLCGCADKNVEDFSTKTSVICSEGNIEFREEVNNEGRCVRLEKVTHTDDGVKSEILYEDRSWFSRATT